MNYRRLGNAGLKVSEISLGGWLTFGGAVDEITTQKILATAIDSGVNFIDLADDRQHQRPGTVPETYLRIDR